MCLRERRLRDFAVAAGTAVASWAAVNAPVALAYPAGWAEFRQALAADGEEHRR